MTTPVMSVKAIVLTYCKQSLLGNLFCHTCTYLIFIYITVILLEGANTHLLERGLTSLGLSSKFVM